MTPPPLDDRLPVAAGSCAAALLLLPAAASRRPARPSPPRQSQASPPCRGRSSTPASPPATWVLKTDARHRPSPGTTVTISGTGLPAGKDVSLTWGTANVDWMLDPRAGQRRLPRPARPPSSRCGSRTAQTDAQRRVQRQAQGAARLRRHPRHLRRRRRHPGREGRASWSPARRRSRPKRGPDRDDDHGHLHRPRLDRSTRAARRSSTTTSTSGAVMANWTRGTAVVHIRATGPVGKHTIEVADAISFKYLNIQQSPIPWGTGFKFELHGHEGQRAGRLPRIDWPVERRADGRREDDARRRSLDTRGSRDGERSASTTRPGPHEGRRHRERAHARRAGRPRLGDGRRQPRQLHRHLLVVRLGSARHRDRRRRRDAEEHRSRSRTGSAAGTSSRSSRAGRSRRRCRSS